MYLSPKVNNICYHTGMSEDININNLAELARIDVSDEQADELKDSIADILDYVSSVEDIADVEAQGPTVGPVHNVMREDVDPHDPDAYRDQLLEEAPETDSDFIVVPPIL
jgi:aspartyl-tRNA(Asn)/glutamyl-tRNA(Gln) amidotransferase subunit C